MKLHHQYFCLKKYKRILFKRKIFIENIIGKNLKKKKKKKKKKKN